MQASTTHDDDAGLAVVVGASGGIGQALLAELRARGQHAEVFGLSRRGTPPLDLLDEDSIARAARHLTHRASPVRLVIDATGFLHDAEHAPERRIEELDPAALARAFALNATGPALLMKHFLPLFPRHGRAVFATLSARVGSIGDNRLGGWYAYRASKAALNQLVRCAAIELRRRAPQAVCVALHPGTTDTALSRPFAKSGLDVQPPQITATRLLDVLDRLDAGHSGGFFDYNGSIIPW